LGHLARLLAMSGLVCSLPSAASSKAHSFAMDEVSHGPVVDFQGADCLAVGKTLESHLNARCDLLRQPGTTSARGPRLHLAAQLAKLQISGRLMPPLPLHHAGDAVT
jgi:hypothetical protein